MKIVCNCCEQWTALPASGGEGAHAHAPCEHCSAPLAVDDYYRICPDCSQYYLAEYETCPLCLSAGQRAERAAEDFAAIFNTGLSKRTSRKGEDYWQVYFDYGEHTSANSSSNSNGHANGQANGVPPASEVTMPVENGHTAPAPLGNGHAGGASVDLAVADHVALTLFPDQEARPTADQADAPVKVGAGSYNEFDYELIQDPSRLAEVAEMLAGEKIVGIDTETTGLDPHTVQLLLLQVSTTDRVYVVDCKKVLPLALKPFLENPDVLKVAQNAKFEYEMLKQQAGIVLTNMYDTMLAERILTAGVSREISLKLIAEKYIGALLDKSVRESFYKNAHLSDAYLAPEELHYAARDAFIMMPIYRKQELELKKHKLLPVAELEFRCIAAVGDIELAGVKIDEERWRKIIADVGVQRDRCAGELSDMLAPATMQATMFGVPAINLNSNVQLIEAFSRLGVDLPDTMEATLVKYDHPAVKKLLEYRGHEKTLSAFGENVLGLINSKTHRIHPDFNQHGADTGRFSCTKPNVQQIPATSDFRKCFVATPGYKLVTCDYSQCELRILAELSGDEGFVTAFRSGGDLHTLTASQMFGVAVDQVQKPQRSAAKAINFGLAYGMGPGGLAPRLGVGLDEAKELIARYFQAYPGVQKWLDKAAKDAVRTGYSLTTIGRKRFYTLPDESLKQHEPDEWRKQIASIERQGKNSPIQGCVVGDTRILVKGKGHVAIRDVCGQDVEVWDGQGYVRAFVAASGKKQLVKLTLRGGHYIECSPDHKFLTACNNGYKWVWKWKKPAEIRRENRVVLNSSPIGWHDPLDIPASVPGTAHNSSRACLTTMSDTRRLGEWLGQVASDGSLGKNNTVSLLVAEHEEPILEQLLATTAHWGHVHHRVRVTPAQPQRLHSLVIGAKSLHDQLQDAGIKERVPSFAWRDSDLLASYLRGLFDGDGTVHPDGALLTFGQGDRHLAWAREVQQALLLLGIRSRINVYTSKHNRINLRVLKRDMRIFCEKIGFLNPAKQEKALPIVDAGRWERVSPQYGAAMLVESIEVTDEWIDMFDVVNSETGRFMANGIIVHNSNADMTKLALINLRTALKDWDARVVNTVHDEIVVEVREDQAEEVKHIVEQEMVRAGESILKIVPTVAEATLADYWSK